MKILTALAVLGALVAAPAQADDGPMRGKMAKYNVAARILNNTTCDPRIFKTSEALSLRDAAASEVERREALDQGLADTVNGEGEPKFCEKLQMDAGNWGLLIDGLRPPKKLLEELKMMTQIDNNNCNWNGDKEYNPPRYPTLARQHVDKAAGTRELQIKSMYGFSDVVTSVDDDEEALGEHPKITKLCNKLENYAKKTWGSK